MSRHGAPDDITRLRIERELPKYTAILLKRIAMWEKEAGVVFCWNGIFVIEAEDMDGEDF